MWTSHGQTCCRLSSGFLFSVILIVVVGCGRSRQLSKAPVPADSRDGRWKQDINYIYDNLVRIHPNAYHRCSQAELSSARDELIEEVSELTDEQLIVRLAGILAMLRDAHTGVPLINDARFRELPIRVERDSEQFFVTAISADREDLLESRVIKLAGQPVEDVVRTLGSIISAENDVRIQHRACQLLHRPGILHAIGLCPAESRIAYTLANDAGTHDVEVAVPDVAAYPEVKAIRRAKEPISSKWSERNYWFEELDDVVYWRYNRCSTDPNFPFEEFAQELRGALDSPSVTRLIIDLRSNGGGSELVAKSFLHELEEHRLNRPGGIVILVAAGTFSSAKGHAMQLRERTHAILLGRPLSQSANTFGEVLEFESPNYNVFVRCSTKYFRRGSDDETIIQPHVYVPLLLAEWKAGIDRDLEMAISYQAEEVTAD